MQPVFYLFAGINGAGKTSLYQVVSEMVELGERVSIDDIARDLGDWRDPALQIRASREALRRGFRCIDEGRTFNQETTLPGAVLLRQLAMAKEKGFTVVLYYLGVETVELAIARVKSRVARGGHGIPEQLIRRRHASMPGALRKVLPLCDLAFFYDNTDMFRQIALFESGEPVDLDTLVPDWFFDIAGDNAAL